MTNLTVLFYYGLLAYLHRASFNACDACLLLSADILKTWGGGGVEDAFLLCL